MVLDVKTENVLCVCSGNFDGVYSRGKVLYGAPPQNAALVVELHDASLYGLACLHVELAVLQAKGAAGGSPGRLDTSVVVRRA